MLILVLLSLSLAACGTRSASPPASGMGERRFTTDNVPPYRPPGSLPPASMVPPAPPPGPGGPKTTVALLLPLTGQHAAIGEAMLNAANMAVFDLGDANFTLLPRDTRGTPEGATAAARDALSQGAKLILGPLLATEIRAVASVARGSGVSVIGFSNDRSVAGNGVYTMGFLPEAEVRRVVDFAARRGIRQFGLIAQRSAYGDLAARATEEAVRRNAGSLRVETVSPDDPGALARAAQSLAGPGTLEAVMIPMFGDPLRAAAAALSANGVDPARTRYLGTAQWEQTPLFTEPALTGAWIAAVPPQARQEFEARYGSTYGRPAPRLATLAYDATALAAALSAQPGGGRYDAAALTSARGFTGADGYFRFASDGTTERGLAVLEVTPNGLRVIDPAPTRAEELLF